MARLRWLFASTIFLASFLLFLVEPIAARQLLPVFGGSAAVWITCLVFFQTALLAAYLYAHWLARHPRWSIHLCLLCLAVAAAIAWAARHSVFIVNPDNPVTAIFAALGVAIGLPFLMLGATSPLLQVWLAKVETTGIPYRLFALSNLASLLALGLYPTLIEPYLTLQAQRIAWSCGFALFVLLAATLAWKTRSALNANARNLSPAGPTASDPAAEAPPTPRGQRLLWILLPMCATMQLSAVTSYITANIAAIPLLWILPLAVYLLTLIIVFQYPRLAPRALVMRLLVVLLASLGYMMIQVDHALPMTVGISFFLIELFAACLFLHGEAYKLRPVRDSESTLFYLFFAAGGALGAFLIGIAAPLLFRFNYDLAITFFLTAVLALAATWFNGWGIRLLWTTASILLFALVLMIHTAYERNTPVAVRNFYGALRVRQTVGYPGATIRTLSNGSIQHGTQIFGDLARTPTTYYARDSGVGLAMENCCGSRPRRIGVIGLGAGTMAAYGRAGDTMRFYEINPAVLPIARNLFTYLRDSAAKIDIVVGDARTSLAKEEPQRFDVLVVDAFSGDAIPLHLLTAQAVALYRKHLAPGGIIAFHISNQHVDLEPAIALLAQNAGMQIRRVSSSANVDTGAFSSTWMLVSYNAAFFSTPAVFNNSYASVPDAKLRLWTDDYSSLLPLLRW